jgi:hypothetical protein
VLDYDSAEPLLDDHGQPVTRWDGRTTKVHPATGKDVPDETARVPVLHYANPRKAAWPDAHYIVGNPPYIGPSRMRESLGDGYAEGLRTAHSHVGNSSDLVMYWWDHAAELVRLGKVKRFGMVTTNSLRQTFNRRTLERHMQGKTPLSLVFAVPDHPWVDAADGADVRIALTVGAAGEQPGSLLTVVKETPGDGEGYDVELAERRGLIHADLTVGANVTDAKGLRANDGLCSEGMKPHGTGFIITPEEAESLGLGRIPGLERYIRSYRNGRDVTQTSRNVMAIDFFGLEAEEARRDFPEAYQWLLEHVKPQRDARKGSSQDSDKYAELWWLFGKPRGTFRPALAGMARYIVTVKTAKHRLFTFLNEDVLFDSKLIAVASDDAFVLGVLSSSLHCAWALAAGGHLGVGNDPCYVIRSCFAAFPFPDATGPQKARIRALGEQLDGHRKRQQEQFPDLTLTGMYNVLEKLRAGDSLSAKEQTIHDQGLVAVLKDLHDELDAAVFAAYGWPDNSTDERILERLVALNAERAAEEQQGVVRWLRPEYQNPEGNQPQAGLGLKLGTSKAKTKTATRRKRPWPKRTSERIQALRAFFVETEESLTAEETARRFNRAKTDDVADLLATLVDLAQLHESQDGRYTSA